MNRSFFLERSIGVARNYVCGGQSSAEVARFEAPRGSVRWFTILLGGHGPHGPLPGYTYSDLHLAVFNFCLCDTVRMLSIRASCCCERQNNAREFRELAEFKECQRRFIHYFDCGYSGATLVISLVYVPAYLKLRSFHSRTLTNLRRQTARPGRFKGGARAALWSTN